MSEKKHNKKDQGEPRSDKEQKRRPEAPGKVINQAAMNRGKPGSDERHKGQSPPPRTKDDDSTVLWETTAQETIPDPQHGSAATASRKSGVPAQPNTPPENADSDENRDRKVTKSDEK